MSRWTAGKSAGGIKTFLDLMPHTVKIAPFSGTDAFGNPTFGADVSYSARISGKIRLVRDATGREVVSSQTVHLGAAVLVSEQDRITLSTADVASTEAYHVTPPIVAVANIADEGGLHHAMVFLQ